MYTHFFIPVQNFILFFFYYTSYFNYPITCFVLLCVCFVLKCMCDFYMFGFFFLSVCSRCVVLNCLPVQTKFFCTPPSPPWRCSPTQVMASSFLMRFLDHTQRSHTTITHNDAPQSVELLWTSDQPITETST